MSECFFKLVHTFLFIASQDPVPPFACQFSPGVDTYMHKCNSIHIHYISLEIPYSHILAVADEEGSLRLLNTRKYAAQSLVKGVLYVT